MKPIMPVGIVLTLLGAAALAYRGITYTTREKILRIGPLDAPGYGDAAWAFPQPNICPSGFYSSTPKQDSSNFGPFVSTPVLWALNRSKLVALNPIEAWVNSSGLAYPWQIPPTGI